MSELKTMKFFEAVPTSKEGFYQPGAFVDGYLKSEADKVIAHNKYKRCLLIAKWCFEKSYSTTLVKYDKESGYRRNFYDWWGKRWLKLAEKFKTNNQTAQ